MVQLPTLLLLSSPWFPPLLCPGLVPLFPHALSHLCPLLYPFPSPNSAPQEELPAPQQVCPIPEAPHQLHISPTFPTLSQHIYNSPSGTQLQEAPSVH